MRKQVDDIASQRLADVFPESRRILGTALSLSLSLSLSLTFSSLSVLPHLNSLFFSLVRKFITSFTTFLAFYSICLSFSFPSS